MHTDVVITGFGVISPIGVGGEAYWRSLEQGQSGVSTIERYREAGLPVPFGGEVQDFDAKQYIRPRKNVKVMSREIQMAVAAAGMAMEDARIEQGAIAPDRLGVVLGSDFLYCPVEELEDTHRACLDEAKNFMYEQYGEKVMSKLFPLWMLKYLPNMAACHISIANDARGPSNSLTLGEVSSLLAMFEAVQIIQRGQADVMICGGVGSRLSLTPLMFRGDANLSHRTDSPERACRPFDLERDGMVNGEGAGILVLESRQHAESRGAKVWARVAGMSNRFGPRLDTPGSQGEPVQAAMQAALAEANLAATQVGHVNANGLGAVAEDAAEAKAIQAITGDTPVFAPKSFFGNLGAGTGAVELIGSVLAMQKRLVPASLNYEQSDPECPVRVLAERPVFAAHDSAVVLNQAAAGQSAAVVIIKD